MSRRAQVWAAVVAAAVLVSLVTPAFSYLPQYTRNGGTQSFDRWDFSAFPVQWNLNPSRGGNVQGGRSVADVMAASFGTWVNAPNSGLIVSRGPDSGNTAPGFDSSSNGNVNLVCMVCQADFSQESETLAVTITTVSGGAGGRDGHGGTTRFAGQILDADILFNPARQFSTDAPAENVEDLQTIATHEIGHFYGLDHSGVVRAVMFAFAPALLRTLSWDDVAGAALVYPSAQEVPTGSIAGTVRRPDGQGVFGAHVFAESLSGGNPMAAFNIRKSPVSALTQPGGVYRIDGLPSDAYMVTAEPLDLPTTNSNIEGYGSAFGQGAVQTNFTTRWF